MRLYEILDGIINRLGIDWIIESSKIDGWTVEKRHSGTMVQIRYLREDKAGWTKGESSVKGAFFYAKSYAFAVPFTSVTAVVGSARVGNGIGYGTTTWPGLDSVNLHITGSQAMSSSAPVRDISIIAVGKWK